MSAIARVLAAVRKAAPAEEWVQATDRLAGERAAIERMLAEEKDLRVYGFNTLLGHLDNVAAVESHQLTVLDGHLVGRPVTVDGGLADLILSVKLEQLSHGGSGVHPETFRTVLDSYGGPSATVEGAWHASYSSGDVVPAAWWIKHLREVNPDWTMQTGDLIALLNGNFVSTAFALRACEDLLGYLARFTTHAVEIVQPGRVADLAAEGHWLAKVIADDLPSDSHILRAGAHLQRAVSMRDMATYVRPVASAVDVLREAVQARLDAFSGNPTFGLVGGRMRHVSQSSFLDLGLTTALTSAIQLTHFCMAAVQRFVQHICDTRKGRPPLEYLRFIQPPKVASALLAEATTQHGTLPHRFQFGESEGIEDQADLSLITARSLAALVQLADDQLAILDDVYAAMKRRLPDHAEYRTALHDRFTG